MYEHIINLCIHTVILFVFLTVFFFIYVSDEESRVATKTINNLINKNTEKILGKIDDWDKKSGNHIEWNEVGKLADRIGNKYKDGDPKVEQNHKKLLNIAIVANVILFLITIGMIVYFKYYKRYKINMKKILIENMILFVLVGIIEFIFFYNVVSHYESISVSYVTNKAIDRFKENFNRGISS